jgi:hypothetical protein
VEQVQEGGRVRLTINANDLLTVLKLAKLSAQEEEHETIRRVARAALEAIDEAISGVAIEPVEC